MGGAGAPGVLVSLDIRRWVCEVVPRGREAGRAPREERGRMRKVR